MTVSSLTLARIAKAAGVSYTGEASVAKKWIQAATIHREYYCYYFGLHDEKPEIKSICLNQAGNLNGVQTLALNPSGTITKLEIFKSAKNTGFQISADKKTGDLKTMSGFKDELQWPASFETCNKLKKLFSFEEVPQDLETSEVTKSLSKVYSKEFRESETEFAKKIELGNQKHACYLFGWDEDIEYFKWTKETCFDAESRFHGIQLGSYKRGEFIYLETFDHGKLHGIQAVIHNPSATVLSLALYDQGHEICQVDSSYDFPLKTFFKE